MNRPGLTALEAQAYDAMVGAGRVVARAGWPDFLVYDPTQGRAFGLEWKSPTDVIRPTQERMHTFLQSYCALDVLVTGDIEEALAFVPREAPWLMASSEAVHIGRLQHEASQLEHACEVLREELATLEIEWRKLKSLRDEQRKRISRGQQRLNATHRAMQETRVAAAENPLTEPGIHAA